MELRLAALLTILAIGLPVTPPLANESGQDPLCSPPDPELILVNVTGLPGGVARLTRAYQVDYRVDIVRGGLATLAATSGDYAQATEMCLADDVDGPQAPGIDLFDDTDLPDVGEGYWYLLRTDRVGGGCGYGAGSYSSVAGCRDIDIKIRNSDHDCFTIDPCQVF